MKKASRFNDLARIPRRTRMPRQQGRGREGALSGETGPKSRRLAASSLSRPRKSASACTHLENRLKYRDLDDPRFWKCLHVGTAATIDKTRVFRRRRSLIKRCVHPLALQGRVTKHAPRLASLTPPTLYVASAARRRPAYGGFIFRAFRARMPAERSVPHPFAPEITRFTMVNRMQFYIDGAWVDPAVKKSTPVVNPATEEAMYEIALGSKADVDKAVAAARRAFETYSQSSREERVALLSKVIEVYKTRMKDIGAAVSDEMGAPLAIAARLPSRGRLHPL